MVKYIIPLTRALEDGMVTPYARIAWGFKEDKFDLLAHTLCRAMTSCFIH